MKKLITVKFFRFVQDCENYYEIKIDTVEADASMKQILKTGIFRDPHLNKRFYYRMLQFATTIKIWQLALWAAGE